MPTPSAGCRAEGSGSITAAEGSSRPQVGLRRRPRCSAAALVSPSPWQRMCRGSASGRRRRFNVAPSRARSPIAGPPCLPLLRFPTTAPAAWPLRAVCCRRSDSHPVRSSSTPVASKDTSSGSAALGSLLAARCRAGLEQTAHGILKTAELPCYGLYY